MLPRARTRILAPTWAMGCSYRQSGMPFRKIQDHHWTTNTHCQDLEPLDFRKNTTFETLLLVVGIWYSWHKS